MDKGENGISSAGDDFSFILFDRKAEFLMASGDFPGRCTLFYALPTESRAEAEFPLASVVFSRTVKGILEALPVNPPVNQAQVMAYLNWDRRNDLICDQTFYRYVYRLLPGERLICRKGYPEWRPAGKIGRPPPGLTEGYATSFREAFVRSVASKTHSHPSPAANLSGGLDSSSVCAVGSSIQPIRSFYLNTDTPDTEEQFYVSSLLEKCPDITHHEVKAGVPGLAEMRQVISALAQPEYMIIPSFMYSQLAEKVAKTGSDLILSGHGGDQVTGYGFDYLDELYDNEDWTKLKEAFVLCAGYYKDNENGSDPENARLLAIRFFRRKWRTGKGNLSLPSMATVLVRHFDIRLQDLYVSVLRWKKRETLPGPAELLKTSFVYSAGRDTAVRPDTAGMTADASAKKHLDSCLATMTILHNEQMFVLSSEKGVKVDYPFCDRTLLELCMAAPLQPRFGEGKGRGLLREAMKGYLPEIIRSRTSKGEFSEYGYRCFIKLLSEFSARQDADTHPVWKIVSKEAFQKNLRVILDEKIMPKKKNHFILPAGRVIYLALWMDMLKERGYSDNDILGKEFS